MTWTRMIELDRPDVSALLYAEDFAWEVSQITYRAHMGRARWTVGKKSVILEAVEEPFSWRVSH